MMEKEGVKGGRCVYVVDGRIGMLGEGVWKLMC